jgi:aryl-phospho-beta-D-glucosidase BglC (GH1 family)
MQRPFLLTACLMTMTGALYACADTDDSGASEYAALTLTQNGATANVRTTSDWGPGFCATLAVRNDTRTDAASWRVAIDLGGGSVTQVWNGTATRTGTQDVFAPGSFGAQIPAGSEQSQAGFCANKGPRPFGVVSVTLFDSNGRAITGTAGTGGASSGGTGGASSGGTGGTGGASSGTGLRATYFTNANLTGTSVSRVEPAVNFDWALTSPASTISADTWSARWSGQIRPQFSETYTFYTTSDDGVRLWVNGQRIIDDWNDHAAEERSGRITLRAGQLYAISLEYYDNLGGASTKLEWSSPSRARQVIPTSALFPTACTPACSNRQCGMDSCGGLCGTCASGSLCTAEGRCESGAGAPYAKDLAKAMVNGFNLGNTFDVGQHPTTAASVNAAIDAYYTEGFRAVRIPVRWIGSNWGGGALASDSGKVNRAHPRLSELNGAIDHALNKGMYVVVNTHHEDWLFDRAWGPGQLDIFKQLWTDISDLYKDKDYRLVFEIVNEPHGTIINDRAAVQALNKSAYDIIRASGGKNARRNLIIDGQNWGAASGLRATWPKVSDIPGGGNDPYLLASVHYYEPMALTHATNANGINTAWTMDGIRAAFDDVAAWSEGKLPIYIGEFGVNWDQHAHLINDNVWAWFRAVSAETRARGWAFAVWDDGGWFRVMNRSNQAFNGLEDACLP